jgi:predicted secreted Zn-dependent protease
VVASLRRKVWLGLILLAVPAVIVLQNHLQDQPKPLQVAVASSPLTQPETNRNIKPGKALQATSTNSQANVSGWQSSPSSVVKAAVITKPAQSFDLEPCIQPNGVQPAQLDLNDSLGLKQIVDTPQFYNLHGQNLAHVRQQLRNCAPSANGSSQQFAGLTTYRVTWKYSEFLDPATGQCRLLDPAVGIHITQTLPSWLAPSDASPADIAEWNSFLDNLKAHENQHAETDKQAAARIMNLLQNFSHPDCESVKPLIQAELNDLNRRNSELDNQTNHGLATGALL